MFLLSELGLYQPTAFWPSRFLMRNMKIILLRVSCTWQFASLIAFNILFVLSSTIWLQYVSSCVSLSVFYLEFIELLEHLYSCFSSNLGSFQPSFLQIISMLLSLSLSLFLGASQYVCLLICVPQAPSALFTFLQYFSFISFSS